MFNDKQKVLFIVFILLILSSLLSNQMLYASNGKEKNNILNPQNSKPTNWPSSFSIIKDDFLVNNDTIGYCEQNYPTVCFSHNGFFALSWADRRDYIYEDIYFQLYDSLGNKIGHNRRVNDDCGSAWQMYPSIAMDSAGNATIVWDDRRRDPWGDIFGQRYSADGLPIGINFRINDDDSVRLIQEAQDIAMRPDGSCIVIMLDTREGNTSKLFAQRYDAFGNPVGANFKINDQYNRCSIAVDSTGSFFIAWIRDGKVFVKKFDYNGNPLTDSVLVSDAAAVAVFDEDPRIACSNEGRIVITWADTRNEPLWWCDVYAQLLDESCNIIGTNFRVNDDSEQVSQSMPSAGIDIRGNFIICWLDYRGSQETIYAQRYDSLGNTIGDNFLVSENPGLQRNLHPRMAMNIRGDYIITWDRSMNLFHWYPDIIAQRFNALGNPVGNNFVVNDDISASDQIEQCIATYPAKGFAVAWIDFRDTTGSAIYYQVYDSLGNLVGLNKKANDQDLEYTRIDAAMDGIGNFAIVWLEPYIIRGQRFDSLGNHLGSNFLIHSGTNLQFPAIAKDWFGNFVVSWCDAYDIYAQRYDSQGNQVGGIFRVNANDGNAYYTDVARDSLGDFIIVWRDYTLGVCIQKYDPYGNPVGGNFKINDDSLPVYNYAPSIDMDKTGNAVVTWTTEDDGNDIYAQVLDSLGNKIGNNVHINDCPPLSQYTRSSVALHPTLNKFVVLWQDWRNPDGDPEVYAQLVENGTAIGLNIQINNPDSFPYNLQSSIVHGVDATASGIYFTWLDCRRHRGADTYAKIIDWQLFNCEENIENAFANIKLNVYPTVSKTEFTIRYSFNRTPKNISLNIYDVSGRVVKQFSPANPKFSTPSHTIWDGRDDSGKDLSAGIYFIRLDTGDHSAIKKVILVR